MAAKMKNEIGNRYGRLLVVSREPNDNAGNAYWNCQCDCGNTTIVRGTQLRYKTRSCGCLQKEAVGEASRSRAIDITNSKFGKLVAINQVVVEGKIKWYCECDCGNSVIINTRELLTGDTKSCGCLKSMGELTISNILQENNISFSKEYSFSDLKSSNNRSLRFDFAIFKNNSLYCLIEYNGTQHYHKSNNYYSEIMVEHDKKKIEYCINNNILLYIIKYNQEIENEIKNILLTMEKN